MTRHHLHHKHHEKSEHGHTTNARGDASTSSDRYGVWKGTPLSYTGQTLEQDRSPHITLMFDDGSGKTAEANINVASTSKDTELVYWMNTNWDHPITKTLTPLSNGFHQATTTDGTGLSLDFIRTSPTLVDFASGQPIIKNAIAAKATVYIFGRDYGTGIDDVHMNQGNTGDYENAVGVDGGLIFQYPSGDQQFEAIFLAFASQEIPTDDSTGAPTSSAKALDTIATGGSSS